MLLAPLLPSTSTAGSERIDAETVEVGTSWELITDG
jgi:hypothetical protein